MKIIKILTSLICLVFMSTSLLSQSEKIHIEGAMILENSQDSIPVPGTIRWTGLDFEGYNGYHWVSLTGQPLHGTVTDIDGNVYRTIRMGSKIWMAENLRTTRYNDGDDIPLTSDDNAWSTTNSGARSYYPHVRNYVKDFGYLYNGHAVQSNKLCPLGWGIPVKDNYENIFQMTGDYVSINQYDGAGGLLKSQNSKYFETSNSIRDAYGFDVRGGGRRYAQHGTYFDLKEKGFYWCSDNFVIMFVGEENSANINNSGLAYHLNNGYSVRCVKPLED